MCMCIVHICLCIYVSVVGCGCAHGCVNPSHCYNSGIIVVNHFLLLLSINLAAAPVEHHWQRYCNGIARQFPNYNGILKLILSICNAKHIRWSLDYPRSYLHCGNECSIRIFYMRSGSNSARLFLPLSEHVTGLTNWIIKESLY